MLPVSLSNHLTFYRLNSAECFTSRTRRHLTYDKEHQNIITFWKPWHFKVFLYSSKLQYPLSIIINCKICVVLFLGFFLKWTHLQTGQNIKCNEVQRTSSYSVNHRNKFYGTKITGIERVNGDIWSCFRSSQIMHFFSLKNVWNIVDLNSIPWFWHKGFFFHIFFYACILYN